MGAIVSDATCLIGLHNIGKIDLLPRIFSKILIPPAVEREFGEAVVIAETLAPSDRNLVNSLALFLGAGESEAIALALEQNIPIILDDKKARMTAESMGLKIVGTVGILLLAKRKQFVPEISPILRELERTGFYISANVKKQALEMAGEN
jgi:predicted nucleic acid-binding protein